MEYAISLLTEREQKVIREMYVNTLRLEDVGKIFGVTRERIRQIQCKAMRKLRHPSKSKYYIKGKSVVDAEIKLREELHEIEKQNNLDAIKKAWEEEQEQKIARAIEMKEENWAIENFGFSVRTYNCLKRAGFKTLPEIARLTKSQAMKIRNLGRKSLDELERKLNEWGFELYDDLQEVAK